MQQRRRSEFQIKNRRQIEMNESFNATTSNASLPSKKVFTEESSVKKNVILPSTFSTKPQSPEANLITNHDTPPIPLTVLVSPNVEKDDLLKLLNKSPCKTENIIDKDFIIPTLPQGKTMKITLISNWGDEDWIGLNGIEVFDAKTCAYADVHSVRNFKKLF